MMVNYKRCPQDTEHYCPHYKSACDEARNDRVQCIHVATSIKSILALTAVHALAKALNVEPIVGQAIHGAFMAMAISPELKGTAPDFGMHQ